VRVILDTNLLVSALIRRGSVPRLPVQEWFKHRFTLVTHEIQIEELRVASRRARVRMRIRPAEAGRLINQLRDKAEFMDLLPYVRRSADRLDDFLRAPCEAGRADYLVTGDQAGLLGLRTARRS
jgi:uncharacterized protein